MQRWTPSSWRGRPAKHIPIDYPDEGALLSAEDRLRSMPPLVFAGEARRLKGLLGQVAKGEAFLLQGGDCAESFREFHADNIRDNLPPDPADGGGADLRRRQARGEGRPAGGPVRQAALRGHRDHRRGHPAVLSRRQHQRTGFRPGLPRSGPRAPAQGLWPVGLDPQPAAGLCGRRVCRPLQHPQLDPGLCRRQPAGRPLSRADGQDQRGPDLHGRRRRHARDAPGPQARGGGSPATRRCCWASRRP